ncbi:MAG: hypothetical protein D6772_10910, partial [Bacteroidetes bacterium]
CDFAKAQLSAASSHSVDPELINTPSSDFGPAIVGQDQVIFSSARTDMMSPGSFTGKAGNSLLVSSVGPDGFLSVPYLLRNNYQVAGGNAGPVTYSPDGTRVIFTRNNFVDGTRQIPAAGMQLALFEATVNPSGEWVNVKPFPFNGSDYSTGYAYFSPDGQAVYYASDRPDGFGGYDIYVSRLVGNSWSAPENLGPVVNSPGHELTPYFDGTNLYFASDWHNGLGGLDVFRATMENGRWTQIFHMGSAINSPRDDYGFIFDDAKNLGYVVSNRSGGKGAEDIYRVKRSANTIKLVIKNASDGSPVAGAIVDFVECGEGAYQADAQGRYSFQAMPGLNCNLVIRGEGYVSTTIPLSTAMAGDAEEIVINLSKISETYPGKIVDYNSRVPLSGVVVRVSNRTTGSSMEAVTDINGDYYVAMSPYTTYDFQITHPGYQDIVFGLPIGDGQNRNLLGVIGMQPGTSSAGNGVTPAPVTPVQPGTGGGTSTTVPGTGTGGTSAIASGFAVQLAAVSKVDLNRFSNLSQLGTVYSVPSGNVNKVRLGVFATRAEAEQALRGVKSRGYKDAFIVTEQGSGGIANPPTQPGTTPPAVSSGMYMVQLAAYSKPQYFDRAKAERLGTVTSRSKGNLTAMLISNIATLSEARNIRAQAQAQGWKGAFIVTEQNGQLVKVE